MTRALGPVRLWVRLYTAGLPADAREARRAELDSDLWEEWHHRTALGSGRVGTAASIWIRWLSGIRGDLAWRVELDPRPAARTGTSPSRLFGMSAGMAVAMLLLLVIVVVNTDQYATGTQPSGLAAATLLLLAVGMAILGVVAVVQGHRVMGRRPAEGALLVVGGALIAGFAWYWLLLPVLAALLVVAHGLWRVAAISGSSGKA